MSRVIKTRLIKRYTLPAVQRKIVLDNDTPWDNKTEAYFFKKIIVGPAIVQMIEKEVKTIAGQGNSLDTSFTIFSDTPVYAEIEGTTFVGTAVYIPDSYFCEDPNAPPEYLGQGGWFDVVQPHDRRNNVLEHTEALLVRDTEATDINNLHKYPDISVISSMLDTRDRWQSGMWENAWVNQRREEEVVWQQYP